MSEQDLPPPRNTWRRFIWELIAGVAWARAFYGRRLVGGAIGLLTDAFSESANQAFFARLPGHPQQAADSLLQVGDDRALFRFRGETDAAWLARVEAAWDDYAQAGTDIQLLRVVNQWGTAGWPLTWPSDTVTIVETSGVGVFTFLLTIPFGMIDPPLPPADYGGGLTYGDIGLYYGIGASTDLSILLWLVKFWKPSRSRAFVKVYYSISAFVTFTV